MTTIEAQLDVVDSAMPLRVAGRVEGVSGLTIEGSAMPLAIGAACRIHSAGGRGCLAEVIGFDASRTLLMPLDSMAGVSRGDRIENIGSAPRIACSDDLLGRVLDAQARPIDGGPPVRAAVTRRIDGRGVPPLSRRAIRQPIATSIRAVDALHTCGRGQRMGIFSGPGVGKSTLLAQIATHHGADVAVVALIGERGREAPEFVHHTLGEAGLRRSVVVVSTADEPPTLRVRAARVACTIAEHFRESGRDVLLLVDSLTRLAQAQRQIGLAAREPPATKGFPPSVFSLLPEILERAGADARGSITGFYTVLVEGDDFNEPIPDAVKGITDGHLWLDRGLANRGHFPAIDMLQSISRVRGDVCEPAQIRNARRVLALLATYARIEDMVNLGAYVPGSNPEFDVAIQTRDRIVEFLRQSNKAPATLDESRRQLAELVVYVDSVEQGLRAAKPATRAPAR